MTVLTWLVIMLPILYQVKSPISAISLGELVLTPFIIYGLLIICSKRGKIKVPKGLCGFYFIPILTTFFALMITDSSNISDSITVMVRIIFYFFLIIVCQYYFDIEKGIKLYLMMGVIAAGYLMLQVFAHYIAHTDMPIPLNNAEILFQKSISMTTSRYYSLFGFRPASIFVEPSYYANYICPLLTILLFAGRRLNVTKEMKRSRVLLLTLFLSITVVLSTSSLGIVYVVVIWICFLFSDNNQINIKRTYKYLIAVMIVLMGIFILGSDLFSTSINRLTSGSSIGPRVYRGFIIYSRLNPIQKLIGIGLNNIGNYVKANGIVTVYDESDLNYTVTLTNRLIATGLVGLTALISFWLVQYRERKEKVSKVLLYLLLVSFIFANGEYSFDFPFLFICILSFSMHVNYRKRTKTKFRSGKN